MNSSLGRTTCSSLEGTRISDVWDLVLKFEGKARECGAFDGRRDRQARDWMHQLVGEMLQQRLRDSREASALQPELEAQVLAREITPYNAARQLIDCL